MLDPEEALQLARKTIDQEAETLQGLLEGLGEDFWHCSQAISNCGGIIWTTAVGTSRSVGERMAHILTCGGVRSMFLSPVDGLHGHSLIIEPTDILIAMSRGGESEDVLGMVEIAKRRGAETLAFVHNTQSALARLADKLLPIRSKGEYELQGVLATTSTVAFAAMCDAVCAVVIEAKGFPRAEFQEAHPGGAVGKTAGSAEGKGRPQ